MRVGAPFAARPYIWVSADVMAVPNRKVSSPEYLKRLEETTTSNLLTGH